MSSHSAHAPIDLAPPARPHPTLALVLGILAVPGSTVAWDLPMGGLYIGLPLAIAAILLGVRARQQGEGKGRATAGIVLRDTVHRPDGDLDSRVPRELTDPSHGESGPTRRDSRCKGATPC